MRAHILCYAQACGIRRLVHRQENAVECELAVDGGDFLDGAEDLRRRLERQGLALERDECVLARFECAMHDGAESGRRVNDDDIAAGAGLFEYIAQHAGVRDETLIAGVVRGFGDRSDEKDAKPRQLRRKNDLAEAALSGDVIEESAGGVAAPQSGAVADGAVGIDVHEQGAETAPRERRREIDRRRRLADAALLADDRQDLAHAPGRRGTRGAARRRRRRR